GTRSSDTYRTLPTTNPTAKRLNQTHSEMISKWDGYRAQLARYADGRVLLRSRQGTNMTASFPEIFDASLGRHPDGPYSWRCPGSDCIVL
ncbi:ATP-dependent DNA ligase, partial [Streptomyces pilosus]